MDCPIVKIRRDVDQVNASLQRIGFPPVPEWAVERFENCPGETFEFEDLFSDKARDIWQTLRGDRFDPIRHEELKDMNIQPRTLHVDTGILRQAWQKS